MRILITGSSGQIGTNLGLRLIDEGVSVLGLDRRRNTWTSQIPFVEFDLCSPVGALLHRLAGEEIDVVVHLAAHAKVHDLVLQPARAFENVSTTFAILELCRTRNIPLVFGSSREAYGDVAKGLISEDRPVVAESPYSASKIAGEAFVKSYANCYGLRALIYRFSNVYGRYDNDLERMERVAPLFARAIAERRVVTVYGPEKELDFTHVTDAVSALYKGVSLLHAGALANETINVATGQGSSLLDLARYIGDALDLAPIIRVEPTRAGEITRYVADISRARTLLGYEPKTFLREGIVKALAEWAIGPR